MSTYLQQVQQLPSDQCWNWPGCVDRSGYGKSARTAAHRFVWLRLRGPIPDGLELDHLCFNTLCVNPNHLEPVTRQENMRRRSAAQRHCKQGHGFTAENTYLYNGSHKCLLS